jgi:hypothetical protein
MFLMTGCRALSIFLLVERTFQLFYIKFFPSLQAAASIKHIVIIKRAMAKGCQLVFKELHEKSACSFQQFVIFED